MLIYRRKAPPREAFVVHRCFYQVIHDVRQLKDVLERNHPREGVDDRSITRNILHGLYYVVGRRNFSFGASCFYLGRDD